MNKMVFVAHRDGVLLFVTMRANLFAAVLALVVVEVHAAPTDACGVKLTVNATQQHKNVARSARPSHVLLVGNVPRRMERDLAAAGHDVETAPNTQSAKRDSYAIVVVGSPDEATQARTKFSEAIVVQRSGDVAVDLNLIETEVRRPVRAKESRPVIAAGPSRAPVAAAAPTETHKIVATMQPTAETPAAAIEQPKPPPVVQPKPIEAQPVSEKIATNTTKTVETAPPAAAQPPAATQTIAFDKETYFTVGSASVSGNKRTLDAAIKWLNTNQDAHVTLEGFADPTGSPDANMALSQSRAESVRDYLVKAKIDSSRIDVAAFGDTKLKYGRADARNRRVEIEAKK
jgi:outer membrane protein OmpA-like peptidoglycan-associated protein